MEASFRRCFCPNEGYHLVDCPVFAREKAIIHIDGQDNARCVTTLFHFWLVSGNFCCREDEVHSIMKAYPEDAQRIALNVPDVYNAPEDDPSDR